MRERLWVVTIWSYGHSSLKCYPFAVRKFQEAYSAAMAKGGLNAVCSGPQLRDGDQWLSEVRVDVI